MADSEASSAPALVLKGAAALTFISGSALVIWLVDKAIRYPDVRARQFGRFGPEAPLWIPLIAFVTVFLVAVTYLFWRAARRLEVGEDLFARRHRRHPSKADRESE